MAIDWRKKSIWTLRICGVGALVGLYAAWSMTQRKTTDLDFQGLAVAYGMIMLIWVVCFLVGVSAFYWPRKKDGKRG